MWNLLYSKTILPSCSISNIIIMQRFGNKKNRSNWIVSPRLSFYFSSLYSAGVIVNSQSWFNEISHPEKWNISMGRFCISPPDASSLPHGWVTTTFSALTTADSGHTINSLRSSVSLGQPSWRKFTQLTLWNKIASHAMSNMNHHWPWWPVSEHWNSSSCHFFIHATWVWKYPQKLNRKYIQQWVYLLHKYESYHAEPHTM